jgi:hypothetical protein
MHTPWRTLNTSPPPPSTHAPEVVWTVPSAEMLDAEERGDILVLADIDSNTPSRASGGAKSRD